MKQIFVRKLTKSLHTAADIPAVMDLEGVEYETIGHANWAAEYPYVPQVRFRIAYNDEAVLLHYHVTEDSVRAVAPQDNGHVWEDSCCEFFSQPANDGTYYNMECNCAGTLLVGCGQEREGRTLAPQAILNNVDRWSSLGRHPFEERIGVCDWQLALVIPMQTFFMHHVESLSGRSVRANFYKCGDALQKPHFLSWNPIEIEKPDFHRPDFFGEIIFE
jgi:hypothetical protein